MRRPSRENLISRALATVDDAITRYEYGGPLVGPEPGARLALAFLFAVASRETDYPQPDGEAFAALWRAITDPATDERGDRHRPTWARTQLAAITRRVGAVDPDSHLTALQERMTAEARRHIAEVLRRTAREPQTKNEARRAENHCYIDRPGRTRSSP